MVVQSREKRGSIKANNVGSTVKYDTSHAWRYMYSASDASKRRSLSICILMVLSAFGPISTVVADHDEGGDGWEEDGPYIEHIDTGERMWLAEKVRYVRAKCKSCAKV